MQLLDDWLNSISVSCFRYCIEPKTYNKLCVYCKACTVIFSCCCEWFVLLVSAVMIAGYTSEYVSTVLERVERGDKTGGIHAH